MRKKKTYDFLTDVELEFMNVLWQIEEGSVRDVISHLPAGRELAYTSAATIMRILDDKGFVTSQKTGKTLIYRANLARDTYQSRSLQDLSAKLFDNAPAALVARLVDDKGLSQESLEEIRALLDRRLGNATD